jgi:hypothetical protein
MVLTQETARAFFKALTGEKRDCRLSYRGSDDKAKRRYEIQWVFKDGGGKWRQYTVVIPKHSPGNFEVHGCRSNPRYKKDTEDRRRWKEAIRFEVTLVMERIWRRIERDTEREEGKGEDGPFEPFYEGGEA